jgi:hypothetical protein
MAKEALIVIHTYFLNGTSFENSVGKSTCIFTVDKPLTHSLLYSVALEGHFEIAVLSNMHVVSLERVDDHAGGRH